MIAKLIFCLPIMLGAFMLYSACFRRSWGKGKRSRNVVYAFVRLWNGILVVVLWHPSNRAEQDCE